MGLMTLDSGHPPSTQRTYSVTEVFVLTPSLIRINFFLSPSSTIVSISPLTPVDLRCSTRKEIMWWNKILFCLELEKRCLLCTSFFHPKPWMRGIWGGCLSLFTRSRCAPYKLSSNWNSNILQVVDWLAYPEYTLNDDLASFVLSPGLYYTSRFGLPLVVCAKHKCNLNVQGLSGLPQPWKCPCWQPPMWPTSSRLFSSMKNPHSILLLSKIYLIPPPHAIKSDWVKFSVINFQKDWMGEREAMLHEREEL